MLADYDELRSSTDVETIKNKITSDVQRLRSNPGNRKPPTFTIEHLSSKVLSCNARNVNIWRSLIPCIPGHALIHHTGFLTNLGVLKAEESSELMTETLKSFRLNLDEFIRPAAVAPPTDRSYTTQRPVHPCTIHLALLQYKEGRTANSDHLSWTPVQQVADILQDALKAAYDCTPGLQSRKMCVAIDVSGSMKAKVNGTKYGIECRTAAASIAFALAKTGNSIDIVMFSKKGCKVLDSSDTDFNNFLSKIKETSLGEFQDSDCTEPLKWAIKQNKTDIEAFVVFTVNENVKEVNEPVEGLQRYRNDFGKANTKMIICTMNVTRYTATDRADPYMLDICGCDANLPLLIQEFVG